LLLLLIVGGSFTFFVAQQQSQNNSTRETVIEDPASRFDTLQLPLSQLAQVGGLAIDGGRTLSINGQLRVNNSLVLAPSGLPTDAVAGQIHYDSGNNTLTYYNGTEFVTLTGSQNVVQNIGGLTGVVNVGGGLTIAGNTIANTGVLSLQGQTGDLSLTSGGGVVIDGTTITNSGVLALGGQNGSIGLGDGLSVTGGSLENTGVIGVTAGSNITIVDDGNGSFTISSTAGGGNVSTAGGTTGRIAKFTGVQALGDSLLSESGTTVTVNGNLSVTGALTLGTDLTVANGGTGASSLTNNGVVIGQGVGALTTVTAAGTGLCLLSTAGAPAFQACPSSSGITSIDGQTGPAITVNNATGAGNVITIDDASTAQKGIAQFNSTNFSAAAGVINTVQNINTGASPTFSNLTLTNALGIASGGTGLAATPTNGQLLIGNGADYSLAALTQGTGIIVTNGAGSIGIASTLGTSIDSSEITDGTILEVDLSLTNAATDNYILSYDQGSGGFTWVDPATAGGPQVDSLNSLIGALTLQGTAGKVTVADNGTDTITLDLDAAVSLLGQTIGNSEIENNAVTLGTQTTGNYQAGTSAGSGISVSGSAGEGWSPTLALGALTADWLQVGAFDIVLNNASSELRILESVGDTFYGTFDVGDLSADQTFTFLQGGTVITSNNVSTFATTGVTAGSGLTGGGTAGALTLDIGAGNGVTVNANDITIAVQANKGLEVDGNGLSLIDCADGEVLKYNGSDQWACATDAGAGGLGDDISVNSTAVTNANFLDTAASGTEASVSWTLNAASDPDDITVNIGNASATEAGTITTGAQTLAGAKTFNSQITAGAGINLGSQTLQGTTAVIDFTNFDVSSGGAVTAVGVNAGTGLLQGTGGLTVSGAVTFSSLASGFLEVDGSGVVSVGTINLGADTTGGYVANFGALTGLSTTGNSGEGSTPTLSVLYGSSANTAVQGNTQITVTAGTNVTGGGTLTLGAGGSLTVNVADSPTFAGDVVIQGGSLTAGADSQAGSVVLYDGGTGASAFTGTLQVATLGQNTVYTLPDPNASTAIICLDTGNCAGAGGGITGSGSTNQIAKFTASGTIGDSSLSDDGTTVATTGTMVIQGGDLTVGTSSQLGALIVHDGNGQTTTLQAGDSSADLTFVLPAVTGSQFQCLKRGTGNLLIWDDCEGGGGGTSGVTSLNTLTGDLTIANSSEAGSTITIDDAAADGTTKGIAAFNATNFSAASGVVNTIQNINTSATPQFAGLTLTGALLMGANNITGTNFSVTGSSGNITAGTLNGQTISSSANFTGTVTVATGLTVTSGNLAVNNGDITSTGALDIVPGGALTVGATGQSLTLRGDETTALTASDSGNTTTLGFETPTDDVTYLLPTAAAGTYDVCSTAGNCVGLGSSITGTGTDGTVALFTDSQVIGDSIITQTGTTIDIAGSLTLTNALGVAYGGTGLASTPTNGQLLIGNGAGYTLAGLTNDGGITVTNGAGSIGLAVNYGASANTAVEGDTTLTCAAGTGNLTGGGNTITLGSGGTCNTINTVANPTFATSVTTPIVQNAGLTLAATGANDLVMQTNGTTRLTIGSGGDLTATGNATLQGGGLTIGADAQAGSLTLFDGGTGASAFTGTLQVATLTDDRTYTLPDASGAICLDTGNCAGQGGNGDVLQNGNSFGTTMTIGTNDSNSLAFETSGATQISVAVGGAATFQNSTDSTSALSVLNAAGTVTVLNADTSNGRIGIGTATPGAALDIVHDDVNESALHLHALSGQVEDLFVAFDGDGDRTTYLNEKGELRAIAADDNSVAVRIKQRSGSQTGNLTEWADISNNILSYFDADGDLSVGSGDALPSNVKLRVAGDAGSIPAIANRTYFLLNNTSSAGDNVGASLISGASGQSSLYFGDTDAETSGQIVYSNLSNFMSFATNGAEAMRLTSGGDMTLQGGDATLGTTSVQGTLVLHDGNGQTATISVGSALAANTALAIPTGVGASDTFCLLTLANCAGGGSGDILQGGNSFTAAMTIGTNDAFALNLETTGTTRLTVAANGSDVTLSSNTDLFLQGATAYISNPQGQTNSEAFGQGATVSGTQAVAVGSGATALNSSIAIGFNATILAGSQGIAIGQGVSTNGGSVAIGGDAIRSTGAGTNGVAIGSGAQGSGVGIAIGNQATGGTDSVAIGGGSTTSGSAAVALGFNVDATHLDSIAIGRNITTTANSQLIIGSSGSPITNGYLGSGVTAASPQNFTLNATGGSGTNIGGADLTLAGGRSTGNAAGGDILFQISDAGGSGTTLNALHTVATVNGSSGAITLQAANDNATNFVVNNSAGTRMFAVDAPNGEVSVNNSGNDAVLHIQATTGTVSPYVLFDTGNSDDWSVGLHDDGSNAHFKIASADGFGSNVRLQINRTTGVTSVNMNGTASTNGMCHSGTDLDAASNTLRELVVCSAAPGDLAEWYEVRGEAEAGEIMTTSGETFTYEASQADPWTGQISPEKKTTTIAKLEKTTQTYQPNVIGVVSSSPYQVMGADIKDQGDNPQPIALTGRVPVKISSSSSPIAIGDYVTTSTDPGKGMRANEAGFAIGKALETWTPESGKETILVFVEQGYYPGSQMISINDLQSNTLDMNINNLAVAGNLEVTGEAIFRGLVSVSDIRIDGHIAVGADTAGTVVIPAGQTSADVTFSQAYNQIPKITTGVSDFVQAIIANKSTTGFTVRILEPNSNDVHIDWTALEPSDP
jgi:hypothetical protein